jgi:CubicO group peptidase (beta-lactamase class C family)
MKDIPKEGLRALERYVFDRMADSRLPGLSIAAVKEGELLYKRGFGFRDMETGSSATPESIYCIGSVTKSFTALAVMQLHEKGLLSINDPIDKYVPLHLEPMGEPIRIRHLLSHSSGIPALGYAEASLSLIAGGSSRWLPISNARDLFTFMSGVEDWVHSRPGERWFYSNEGFILLGAIIEAASGERYADYVKRHVLQPLKMDRSFFYKEEVERDLDVATPYTTGEEGERVATRYPYGEMISDGGLMSSAVDMSNYVRMLLAHGEFEGRRVASPESVKVMMEPKVSTPQRNFEGQSYMYYGYGLRIKGNFFGLNLVNHSGSVYASSAYLGFIPERRVGVVVLTNAGYFLENIGEYALALLIDKDPTEMLSTPRARLLDALTGNYQTYRGTMSFRVSRNGGILQLETQFGRRGFTTPLIPVDLNGETKVFHIIGTDGTTPVEFAEKGDETFMIYERYMAKKISSL